MQTAVSAGLWADLVMTSVGSACRDPARPEAGARELVGALENALLFRTSTVPILKHSIVFLPHI